MRSQGVIGPYGSLAGWEALGFRGSYQFATNYARFHPMEQNGQVTSELKNNIGTITFGHPKGNSMPGALLRRLADEISRVGQDESARVIVLQSLGEKVFCSGASFDEIKAVKTERESLEFFSGFANVVLAIKRVPKFVISKVQGKAAGGGVGIICACDYALASQTASIRLSELAIGIGPFIIGPAVLRKVGTAAFTELSVSADWRDAEWARAHGVFASLYPSHGELDTATDELAAKLSGYNPEAMKALKSILWEGTDSWETLLASRAKITAKLALSEFVQAAIAKF